MAHPAPRRGAASVPLSEVRVMTQPNDRDRETSGSSNPRPGSSSPSPTSGAESAGGERGDLYPVVEELVKGVECLCGEPAQRDPAEAKRHLDQAKRMLGSRTASRTGSGRDDDATRSTAPRGSNPPSGRSDDDETQQDLQRAMR